MPATNDSARSRADIFCLAKPTTAAATKNTPMRPLAAAAAMSLTLPWSIRAGPKKNMNGNT